MNFTENHLILLP